MLRIERGSRPTRSRDGDKGSACRDRPALNVVHEPPGHVPALIYIGQRLRARSATVAAQIALSLDLDQDLLALCRQVVKMLNIPAVFHESCTATGSAPWVACPT